jgi:hypothetical protein
MGYRSTVAYTIRFIPRHSPDTDDIEEERKAKSSFYLLLAEAKANVDTSLCFTDTDCFEVDEEKLQIRFFAESVKWYEDYPDVKCHEALIDLSKSWADDDTSNPYIGGAFARVGEDLTDIQEECWGQGEYQWISIARSVCVDWE